MKSIKEGTIKRLHVDKHLLRKRDPKPLTIQTSKGSIKTCHARIAGPSTFTHSYDYPLKCGAKAWVETTAEVFYD
jgi:hypothetical protein